MQTAGIVKVLKNRELQIREIQNRELQGLPVILVEYQLDWMKIVDFLLIAHFCTSPIFYCSYRMFVLFQVRVITMKIRMTKFRKKKSNNISLKFNLNVMN